MTTSTIKHRMLVHAKIIANTEFKDKVEKVRNLSTLEFGEYITPASVVRNDYINSVLREHPEYDETTFRGMIKTYQHQNKQESI